MAACDDFLGHLHETTKTGPMAFQISQTLMVLFQSLAMHFCRRQSQVDTLGANTLEFIADGRQELVLNLLTRSVGRYGGLTGL